MPGKPFCPNCGRSTKTWGLCDRCSEDLKTKRIEVRVCLRCKHYLDRGKWHPFVSLEELNKNFASRGLSASFKKGTCEPCRRFSSGYLEAVIQLRTKNQDIYDMLVKKLDELHRKDPYSFYRQKPRRDGIDFELGTKYAASRAIRSLSTFRLKVVKNVRVVGMRKGRRTTRDVYVVR